ncbi:MAG: hypothetical protein Q9165_005272 [Trypethelium subeluteriae]
MDLFSRRRSRFREAFKDTVSSWIRDESSGQTALGSSSASTCPECGSAIKIEEKDEWDAQEILQVLQARGLDAYWSNATDEIVLSSMGIIRPPFNLTDCTVLPSLREQGFDISTAHSLVRHALNKAHRDIESMRRILSLRADNATEQSDTTTAAISLLNLDSGPRSPPVQSTSTNTQTVQQPRTRASSSEPSIPALAGPSRNLSDIRFPLRPNVMPLGLFSEDDEAELWGDLD